MTWGKIHKRAKTQTRCQTLWATNIMAILTLARIQPILKAMIHFPSSPIPPNLHTRHLFKKIKVSTKLDKTKYRKKSTIIATSIILSREELNDQMLELFKTKLEWWPSSLSLRMICSASTENKARAVAALLVVTKWMQLLNLAIAIWQVINRILMRSNSKLPLLLISWPEIDKEFQMNN